MSLKYLTDLWDESHAKTLDDAALLRYRSNLLGSDLAHHQLRRRQHQL